MQPRLARIDLYPIKSLDGVSVTSATVLPSGALAGDRAFALCDSAGKWVNGKRDVRIHQVRSRFSADLAQVTLWHDSPAAARTFDLLPDNPDLEHWLSDYFQQPITVIQNRKMGFPDDTDASGPTVISTATLTAIAAWFELDLEEARRRFRTNLEIDGVPAFWEDRLFSDSGVPVPFQVGAVTFHGINPCQRCVVPTRDSRTGHPMPQFQRQFTKQRAATLPEEVARSRFNHFFRLAVNTRVADRSRGTQIQIGDAVSVAQRTDSDHA